MDNEIALLEFKLSLEKMVLKTNEEVAEFTYKNLNETRDRIRLLRIKLEDLRQQREAEDMGHPLDNSTGDRI